MVKILNCYLYAKKSYGTLSKGAIFLANPVLLFVFEQHTAYSLSKAEVLPLGIGISEE